MDEYVLPEKGMLEKAATIKRFEYSPSGSELKKQTSIPEKQYQKYDDVKKLTTKNKKQLKELTIDRI